MSHCCHEVDFRFLSSSLAYLFPMLHTSAAPFPSVICNLTYFRSGIFFLSFSFASILTLTRRFLEESTALCHNPWVGYVAYKKPVRFRDQLPRFGSAMVPWLPFLHLSFHLIRFFYILIVQADTTCFVPADML